MSKAPRRIYCGFFKFFLRDDPVYNTQFHGVIRGDIRVTQQDFQSLAPTQAPGEKKSAAAEEMDVDIIVMASHGLGGLPRTFYGSVTAGVLQKIDRPLLIIRTRRIE